MNILALDTSGPVCGAAVMAAGEIRCESMVKNSLTHSRNLMPMVEDALGRAGFQIGDMDLIAVTVGPGSFTGVRLGVEAAKALAHVLNIPCLGVDALEATAQNISRFSGIICPIQDARVHQVYGAAFDGETHQRLMADQPMVISEFAEAVAAFHRPMIFLGDGLGPCGDTLRERFPDAATAYFAPAEHMYLRPAAVARLAQERAGEAVTWQDLKPLYLRAPRAERQKNLVEGTHG